jgi:hypothetical protein
MQSAGKKKVQQKSVTVISRYQKSVQVVLPIALFCIITLQAMIVF